MESETGGLVECGVGTIVWVRRRNGSWWPGKILGSDELSASHLMSPRSGTPVKLLGREDASVDWYNLEKSKRVKPFRCGEFDDCIERAEASQGMPPKKREKYARREDAILHALDLEKQFVENKYAKLPLHSNNNNNNCFTTKLLPKDTQSEFSCDNGKHAKLSLSLEDKRKALYLKEQEQEHEQMGTHLNVDGNSQDVRPRLRGLQDLGVAPISFNYKHSSLNGSSNKHAVDDDDDDDGVTLETMIHVGMLEKRKRSQEGNMEESMGKRRDRRRPLVQVLNSSAKLPLQLKGDGGEDQKEVVDPAAMLHDSFNYLPHQVEPKFDSFPVGLSEENNTTGSNEDTETDSSGTESLLSDTYDAMAALSDEGEDIEFIPKAFGRSVVHEEVESMSEDESGVGDESGDSLPSSVTVSKWQLKGKRNSRKYPERNMHWNSFKGGEESSFYDKNNMKSQAAMVGYDIINWEVEQQQPLSSSSSLQGGVGYWVVDPPPSALYFSSSSRQFGGRIKSVLIEVEVQVQSGYQREHVPMISLMSKLNDNAIVGHPIPIETLEDGSSDNIILSAAADEESFLLLLGGGGALDSTIQPWTTARRTAKCRVPRPPHLSTLEEEEEEEEEEASFDEYVVEELNRKGRKLMKKPQRKTSSSCNQKIRTLSSIGESRTHQQNMDLKSQCYKGGVMKPESLPTAVACIPVKLVFSRLHEELVARHQ